LKVLFVTPRYFPFIGGVENHVYQVARRLRAGGDDVTVLTTDPDGRLQPEEVHEGVQIQRVRAWPRKSDFYFAPEIRNVIRERHWDIVHLQSYHTLVAPLAMQAAWQAHIPYIVTFHGGGHSSKLRNRARGFQRRMMRPLFAHASAFIATAHFEIDEYSRELNLPKDCFVYIPNGADIGENTRSRSWQPVGRQIISVGRLEQYKGHQRILAAMPFVLEKHPDARLRIAGDGPYREELTCQAEELGISDRVEIRSIPASDRQAMVDELSKASLMVLMSEFETHPMSVLEAACLGVPVLVADTSGLSELADQGIARAVPLESRPEQVAAAVVAQLDQPLIPPRFELPTWDECAEQLADLYRRILNHS
jgi:glycosyltransferase involved in cell wall biosynthesis